MKPQMQVVRRGGYVLALVGLLGAPGWLGALDVGDAVLARSGVAFAAAGELPVWANGQECVECHKEHVPPEVVDGEQPAQKEAAPEKTTGAATSKTSATPEKVSQKETEAEAESAEESAPLMAKHAALDCQLCHPDNDDMDYAHWGVDVDSPAPEKLKYSKVDPAVCVACHEKDATPESTKDVTALTDSNGSMVNPHDLPDPDGAHASVGCANCHSMHSETTPEEAAYQRCIDCHHVEVWGCACHDE